jgi:hypothetical protein
MDQLFKHLDAQLLQQTFYTRQIQVQRGQIFQAPIHHLAAIRLLG